MASHFGNDVTPGSGWFFDDVGTSQYGSIISGSFPGGYVTDIFLYVGGDGSSVNIQYCIWGTGGSLLWNSAAHSIPAGTRSIGGQGWVSNGVTGNPGDPGLFLSAGTNLRLGFQTDGNVVWTWESNGSVEFDRGHSSPTSFTGDGSEGSGALGAYLVYLPYNGNGHVMRAGTFTTGFYQVERAGSPSQADAYVMRNGVFVKGT